MNNEENKNYGTLEEEEAEAKAKAESTLFGAPTHDTKNLTKRQKATNSKRQKKTILILAIVVAALIPTYFFAIVPLVNYIEEVTKEEIELLEGEVLGTNDRILMFDHTEKKEIESIEIHNEHGTWGIYYDYETEEFYITDHPEAPYSKELLSSLVVSAGYTLSMKRVTTDAEDMSEYGLSEADNPAWYTLKTRDGEEHTVYIGGLIPTGAGYYCRYKDRNAVYVLDNTVNDTILQPLEVMITPMITYPMQTNDYFTIKNFTIMETPEAVEAPAEGEAPAEESTADIKIMVTYLNEEEKEAEASMGAYKMLAPASYTVNDSNYSVVLEKLVSFQGTSCIKYAPEKADMEEYGLLDPKYVVYYEYPVPLEDGTPSGESIQQYIYFSEKNENGNYYVYSALFNLITEVEGTNAEWLEWDLIKWVDEPIFMMNINDVATITVESETAERVFDLVGEGQELIVTERATGFQPEVQNFRQFYKTLLSVQMEDYAPEDSVAALDMDKDLYMTLTIETRAGKVHTYKFYPYSTRRAFYTVDGEGEFYVLRDMATKVITDAEKVMTDTPIDSEAHN